MTRLPESLLVSLKQVAGFDEGAFKNVHESGERVTSVRTNPGKTFSLQSSIFNGQEKIPWSDTGYYLKERPSFTFDPLFHAGCYYVQEASSMFLEQALKQTIDLSTPLRILDLTAAPGGKSTHLQSLITKDSLLVSNEVIRSRANILQDNMIKWGCENVVITNNDPKDFARLENYFDVIVVDAPCSGSGLFRRDEEAINEWSLNNVQLCSQRQQRIVADVWPALKRDGILIYSTCSYSKEEDEDILDWVEGNLSVVNCRLSIREEWKITETRSASGAYGYRFWPDKIKGEGFFIACIKKTDGGEESSFKPNHKFERLNKKEEEILTQWIKKGQHQLIKYRDSIYAVRQDLLNDINFLLTRVRVAYFGTQLGELIREKFIPAHALAMSHLVTDSVGKIELEHEEAIRYLKKKELKIEGRTKGWQLVTYQHHPLGWINVLPNRINNYYPKELRILKDI